MIGKSDSVYQVVSGKMHLPTFALLQHSVPGQVYSSTSLIVLARDDDRKSYAPPYADSFQLDGSNLVPRRTAQILHILKLSEVDLMPKSRRTRYDGKSVNMGHEASLYKRPDDGVEIAEYPIVDMHNVFVTQETWEDPADLLVAGPSNPVQLSGIVTIKGKNHLLRFPTMTGFAVEDGDDGLTGNCNLFALGNCCWYKICSAASLFQPMFDKMNVEARIYWILRDRRGDWMNLVDQAMAEQHPYLQDHNSQAYMDALIKVGSDLEYMDQQNYQSHWRTVHELLRPECEAPSWHTGFELGAEYARYLLNHMLVDQKEFLWRSSWSFKQLGKRDVNARTDVYKAHDIALPTISLRSIRASESTPQQSSENISKDSDIHHSADLVPGNSLPIEPECVDPGVSPSNLPINASGTETIQEVANERKISQATTSRKRKRESASPRVSTTSEKADKSRGWNDFERLNRPLVRQQNPNMSKKGINKLLGRMFQQSKPTSEIPDEESKKPGAKRTRQTGLAEETQEGCPSQLTSTQSAAIIGIHSQIPVERYSDKNRSKRPFAQIAGRNIKQAALALETLQTLLYEPEVTDLSIKDMIHVWMRDYGERLEKVIALITCNVKDFLEGLSATDTSESPDRHGAVSVDNVWRSMTIYDQLYKLYKISDQDSDLMALIDWKSENIFHALGQTEGIWYAKDEGLLKKRLNDSHPTTVPGATTASEFGENLVKFEDETSNLEDHQSAAKKGQPSLRPAKKSGITLVLRNGLKSESEIPSTPRKTWRPSSMSPQVVSESGQPTSITVCSNGDSDAESDDGVCINTAWQKGPQSASQARSSDKVKRSSDKVNHSVPAPKLDAFTRFKVIRGPEIRANNAGIWRCRIANCFYFRDEAETSESQEAILDHYDMHADAMQERQEVVGEMTDAQKAGMSALRRKLEQEAVMWRKAMENDAFIVG